MFIFFLKICAVPMARKCSHTAILHPLSAILHQNMRSGQLRSISQLVGMT